MSSIPLNASITTLSFRLGDEGLAIKWPEGFRSKSVDEVRGILINNSSSSIGIGPREHFQNEGRTSTEPSA